MVPASILNPWLIWCKIIMDTYIPRWSREKAKEAVRKAILENSGKIDAILAPNDGLAGAAADAVTELGIKIMW